MTNIDNSSENSDEEIASRAAVERIYFAELVKRYQNKLHRYIRRISSVTEEDAEDMLQDIFIKMYTNINSYDPDLKFSTWAYRITHNHVISDFRKRKIRPEKVSIEDYNHTIIETLASELNLEKEIDRKYLKEKTDIIFHGMDIKYREILILQYLEEQSYQEISDILKIPMGSVATRINRAKKHFKKLYENSYEEA